MSSDHPRLRIGNAERDAAAAMLRSAAEEGRLTSAELEERLQAAAGARTQEDLAGVLADLVRPAGLPSPLPPAGPIAPAVAGPPGYHPADPLLLTATMSKAKRQGSWEVPPFIRAQALLDTVKLDCLFATSAAPVIDLEVLPGAGTILLVLPDGWAVNAERLGKGIGTVSIKVPGQPSWGNPVFVVRGSVGLGTFKARGPNWMDKRVNRLDR